MSVSVSAMSPGLRRLSRTASATTRRGLHSSVPRRGSPFFALAALSNSRETQHISKLSKLSRVEHSPNLQLIKSSEVLPFASAPPPPPVPQSLGSASPPPAERIQTTVSTTASPDASVIEDADLMSVGRAILAQKDAEIRKLNDLLVKQDKLWQVRERSAILAKQRAQFYADDMAAGLHSNRFWKRVLLVMLGSTAAWMYVQQGGDSQLKRILDASSIHLGSVPAKTKVQPVTMPITTTAAASPPTKAAPVTHLQEPVVPPVVGKPVPIPDARAMSSSSSSWPNIFWARP